MPTVAWKEAGGKIVATSRRKKFNHNRSNGWNDPVGPSAIFSGRKPARAAKRLFMRLPGGPWGNRHGIPENPQEIKWPKHENLLRCTPVFWIEDGVRLNIFTIRASRMKKDGPARPGF